MKLKPSTRDMTSQEYRTFITTGAIAGLVVFTVLLANIRVSNYVASIEMRLTALALGGALYIVLYSVYLATLRKRRVSVMWLNALVNGFGLMAIGLALPPELSIYYRLIAIIAIVTVSLQSERLPILFVIIVGTLIPSTIWLLQAETFLERVEYAGVPLATVLVSETLIRIQNVTRQQIHRLETINLFSRQLASTLNRDEILALLNEAIPQAVEADTYYVGIQEGDEIFVPLFFDDGEYFNGRRVKLEGTLSGWVIQNNRELFLSDLREPLDLPGVTMVKAGQDKESLSWIGVPFRTDHIKGIVTLASYQPNAFSRGDIELLANLTQHLALALENALIHEDVERRSRLDQMTGAYNHGYFLEVLQKMADDSLASESRLSLIMLDVDYFKNYNDTYGHLVGDKVLNILCDTIRSHIKNTDAVGRWGGEEFIIALPGATGKQAFHVAERIRKTMNAIEVPGRVGEPIPAPTVSQGIAEFPGERQSIYDLIDLADQRLYNAKGRGRNQIEPGELYWSVPD